LSLRRTGKAKRGGWLCKSRPRLPNQWTVKGDSTVPMSWRMTTSAISSNSVASRLIITALHVWMAPAWQENVACRTEVACNEKVAEHWTLLARLDSLIGNEKINEDEIVIDH